MFAMDAFRVLVRRWYIVLAGLVLTAITGAAALFVVPTEYQASGQVMLLLPPIASGVDTPSNPYLNLPPELTITASIIAGSVTTKDMQEEMVDSGFPSEYSVALNPGSGPTLLITTTDSDPGAAERTRDEVIDRLRAELERIQSEVDVPERQLITARTDSVGLGAEVLPGSKVRALAVIGALGVVLTLLVTFAVDRMLKGRDRRRRRRAPERTPAETDLERQPTTLSLDRTSRVVTKPTPSAPGGRDTTSESSRPRNRLGPRRASVEKQASGGQAR